MKTRCSISHLLFLLLCGTCNLFAQSRDKTSVSIIQQERIENKTGPASMVDRRVWFEITNVTHANLFVYGVAREDGFYPLRSLLKMENITGAWKYVGDQPVSWDKESSIFKDVHVLRPGESVVSNISLSSYSDSGKSFMIAVYLTCVEGKAPVESRSNEFVLD